MSEPAGIDAFLNGPIEKAMPTAAAAPASHEPAGLDQFISEQKDQKEFGSLPQEILAGVEGAGRGATLGLSDEALVAAGSDPERIKGRMRANPKINALSQVGGAGALIAGTGGLGALAEGAGLGTAALAYGAEGALMGAGQAVSDHALGDPNLSAQKVMSEIGMGAVLGVGGGLVGRGLKGLIGKSGLIKGSIGDEVANASAESSAGSEAEALSSRFKENAPDIIQAGKELNAPVMEGMLSADPWVQKAEDALVNGAPTYAGIRRAKLYEKAYESVKDAVKTIVGEPEVEGGMSKAQLGNALENSLGAKISEENAPISKLYDEIRTQTREVGVSPKSLPRIVNNIMELDAVRVDPDGPAGALAKRMAKNIENIKTVDDVKALRKVLNDSLSQTASNGERYVMGEISDRLKDLERNTVRRTATGLAEAHEERLAKLPEAEREGERAIWDGRIQGLKSLVGQMDQADKAYAPFIEKIKTLAKMLGKKSISGAQGAINFISTDLSPEQLASRAFQKGNSEMATFFAKSFPEEWELVKQYQKSILRDAAVVDRTGEFNARNFLKQVDKLEPEIQKLLFSPEELKKLTAAKTYLRSIPEDFNPSGTSHMKAFRELFEHPASAVVANLRDFGIEAYIKAMGKAPPGLRPDATETGMVLADKFNKFNAVRTLMDKAEQKMDSGVKAIFSKKGNDAVRGAAVEAGLQLGHSYDDRVKRIMELSQNAGTLGNHMTNQIEPLNASMPNFSQGVQYSMISSVQYLDSKIPRPKTQFMMSQPWVPSEAQKQKFNKYYDAVNNPMMLLDQLKEGSVTHESLEAVQATHPDLFQEMRTKVLGELAHAGGKNIDHATKMSLAKFLGQPLDSSMLPQVIISNQMTFSQQSPNGPSPKQQRSTQAGLAKLNISQRSRTKVDDLDSEGGT